MLTPANTDDCAPLKMKGFTRKLFGKLFGDKGYLSQALFEQLFFQGIHLVTKLRKNMKTKLVTPMADAILLRKRAICETIIDQLKNIFQIEHSRHRSPRNFLTNLFSALIAYNFIEKTQPQTKVCRYQTIVAILTFLMSNSGVCLEIHDKKPIMAIVLLHAVVPKNRE